MRSLIFYVVIILAANSGFSQKFHDIKINLVNYDNDTLLLAYFYGEKQLVKDTLFATKKGSFEYKADSILDPGVYIALVYPSKEYFQFLVNENELKFTLNGDYKDLQNITVKGSKDNKLFFDYLSYIAEKNKLAKSLNEEKTKLTEQKLDKIGRAHV